MHVSVGVKVRGQPQVFLRRYLAWVSVAAAAAAAAVHILAECERMQSATVSTWKSKNNCDEAARPFHFYVGSRSYSGVARLVRASTITL